MTGEANTSSGGVGREFTGYVNADGSPVTEVGCTFVIFRGAMTGNVITCGACDWCRSLRREPVDD